MKISIKTIKWMVGLILPSITSIITLMLLKSFLSVCQVAIAAISKSMIDAAVERETVRLGWMAAAFIAVIILQIFSRLYVSTLSVNTLETVANTMRQKLFKHLSHSDWMSISGYHSDDILTRMTSDVNVAANGIVNTASDVLSLGVGLAAAFTTLFMYDHTLALFAFAAGPAAVLMSRIFGKRMKRLHLKTQETEGVYRAFLHEALLNIVVVKAFQLEETFSQRLGSLQNSRLNWVKKRSRLSAASNSILSACYWVGYFFAFGWGAIRLSAGTATFGTFTAFLQLVGQVQSPIVCLANNYPQLVTAAASAFRLMELEKLSTEHTDSGITTWTSAGIRIENASYEYEKGKPVLRDITAEFRPGEMTAIAGPSGEGKTTLVRMLISLVRPVSGHIYFIHGNDIKLEADARCRALVSYVPQGNTLFSGTITENLLSDKASAAEIETALRTACAWEFISELPDGLETIIGEKGLGLSEGQTQRIAIARALLRKTPVLILDEATSGLDVETEMNILQALQGMKPTVTCIVITHRPSAMSVCDRLFILEDGSLAEYPAIKKERQVS